MLHWSITFFLLAVVSAIFAFAGTADGVAGLFGYAVTIVFLVTAVVVFLLHCRHHGLR